MVTLPFTYERNLHLNLNLEVQLPLLGFMWKYFIGIIDQCQKQQKINDRFTCCKTLLVNHVASSVVKP